MNNTSYSWEQFDEDCQRLARWAYKFKFKNIYGIPRSGMIVAVRVAHLLDLPVVTHISEVDPDDTLVVDDLSNTGSTIAELEESLGDLIVATLVWNENCPEPDYYCRKKEAEVVFPWETNPISGESKEEQGAVQPVSYGKTDNVLRINKKGMA